jgi:hypothetical protein
MTFASVLFAGIVLPFVRRSPPRLDPPEDPPRDPRDDPGDPDDLVKAGGCALPNL